MDLIVLERRIDPPMRIDDVPAMEAQAAWCMEQHRVSHLTSLLSLDGRELVCLFEAPDLESVRNVLRQLDAPFGRIWTATIHTPPSLPAHASLATGGQALVVVERSFPEPTDFMTLQGIEDRGTWCLDRYQVRFARTYFATDRRRMICIYAAPDAEAVRRAQTQAGLPFDRLWAAMAYEAHASQD